MISCEFSSVNLEIKILFHQTVTSDRVYQFFKCQVIKHLQQMLLTEVLLNTWNFI